MDRAWVLLLLSASAAVASGEQVTPVQKVIQLLNGMVEKGKKEKHDEQMQFAAYKQFCDDTTIEKQRSIKEANEAIDMLTADIAKYDSEASDLGKAIATHDEDIATWSGDYKAATKVREIENTDYNACHQDYSESISALREAVQTLENQNHATEQAGALMQLANIPLLPEEGRKAMQAFMQRDARKFPEEDVSLLAMEGAPEANAYGFQSQGLIDMLEKLQEKFEDERTELERAETSALHSYEMLSQDLKAQMGKATDARTEKAEAKGKALQAAADARGDLADTTTTRDDDTKFLSDMTATCEAKAAAFEERQQLRAEEIAAVEKAIEILSSGAVSGASEKHLPQLLQKSALAQLRDSQKNPSQARVAAYLRDVGTKLDSKLLSALATRVSEDPFKKVTKMIKDLVYKLMEEANEEAEHKGWCDTEMAQNEQTRKEKTEAVEMATAEIDELTSSVAKLSEELSELTKAVSDLDAAVAKATNVRADEKAKNTQTIKDAQEAQTAVAQALSVLKEFYAKAGEATALLQHRQQPQAPAIFDEPYRGMGGESGGVVGMIEVIQSDFARLESETTAGEAQAQKEYDEFMEDASNDKASKSSDIDHKKTKKVNQEQALQERKTDLEGEQKELDASMEYWEKLKPSCMTAVESYEERVARRRDEIASLQEALKILSGEMVTPAVR